MYDSKWAEKEKGEEGKGKERRAGGGGGSDNGTNRILPTGFDLVLCGFDGLP